MESVNYHMRERDGRTAAAAAMNDCKKVLQLPPGFKFEPTDEEVVFEYLKCKVFNLPLPPYSLISEVEPYVLYQSHPSNLLFPSPSQGMNDDQYVEHEGYFFCKRSSEYGSCSSWNWKVVGDDEQILPTGRGDSSNISNMIGMKRSLVLHAENNGMTPHWVMHEYRLLPAATNYYTYHHQFNNQLLHQNEWVLCHVFQKKQSTSRLDQQQALSMQYRRQYFNDDDDDGNEDDLSSSSSSPTSKCSSAVTDDDDEDVMSRRW